MSKRNKRSRRRKRKYVRFTEKDDRLLLDESKKYSKIPWTKISREIFNEKYNPGQLFQRYHRVLMPSRASWTEDEDVKLWDLVEELGTRWSEISRRLGTKRCDVWCRQRYNTLKARREKEERIQKKKRKREERDNLEAKNRKRKFRKTNDSKKMKVLSPDEIKPEIMNSMEEMDASNETVETNLKYEAEYEKHLDEHLSRPRKESSPHRGYLDRVPPPLSNEAETTTPNPSMLIPRPPMLQSDQINLFDQIFGTQYHYPNNNNNNNNIRNNNNLGQQRGGLMGGSNGIEVFDRTDLKSPEPDDFNPGLNFFPYDDYHPRSGSSLECISPHAITHDLFDHWNHDILMI